MNGHATCAAGNMQAAEADATRQAMGSRFVAEPLRAELQQRAYAVAAQLDPESQAQVRRLTDKYSNSLW